LLLFFRKEDLPLHRQPSPGCAIVPVSAGTRPNTPHPSRPDRQDLQAVAGVTETIEIYQEQLAIHILPADEADQP
jgi:hypothetical protein